MNPDSDALGQERAFIMQDIESLFSFIEASPAAPGAVAEAVRRLTVKDMPLTVILDARGGDLYQSGPAAYLESEN